MRIALLLTGQLRTFNMTKHLHMNSLISKYNTDVFLGIDVDNSHQCEYKNFTDKTTSKSVHDAIQFFKPVDTFLLDKFDCFKNKWQHLFIRQYYVVKNTYKLLIDHINKHTVKYDLIIRLRFDQLIFDDNVNKSELAPLFNDSCDIVYNECNTNILNQYTLTKKLIFEKIDNDVIYVFGFGDYKHYKYANDQFFYHNPSILNKMFEFYDNILHIMDYCKVQKIGNKGALIECIFYLYMEFNNIKLMQTTKSGMFIRECISKYT
jgi:hypothetical protein